MNETAGDGIDGNLDFIDCELVELGVVSEDTCGNPFGSIWDGGVGLML